MARCPVLKQDPDACVDFSTRGDLPTQAYKDGWERLWGDKKKRKLPPHPDAHTERFK
ncbi:unnamed protein product [marine sediment metagenome]|uniref:Uncharacterized protein n=1 Tax=marine sediment metagenome TaxID=412755 RepID=X0RI05_9ZZZZ